MASCVRSGSLSRRRSGRISRTPRPVVTRSSKSRPASPLSPMRVSPGRIASVRRACTSNAAATSRSPIFGLCWKTGWETALQAVAEARAELARRQALRPKTLTSAGRAAILALGDGLHQVWDDLPPPTRTASNYCTPLLDEVNITVHRDRSQGHADLVLRWKGATLSELTTPPSASHQRSAPMRTPSAWSPPDCPLPRRQDRLDPQLARPQACLAWTRDPVGASALAGDRRRRAHSAPACRST